MTLACLLVAFTVGSPLTFTILFPIVATYFTR